MRTLTGKQVRHLRGLGHHVEATIMIGKDDITGNLVQALDENLEAHELVKVKLQRGCLLGRREAANVLAEKTDAAIAQILGNTILLYRPSEEQRIKLPV